jgi:hypothetical protein
MTVYGAHIAVIIVYNSRANVTQLGVPVRDPAVPSQRAAGSRGPAREGARIVWFSTVSAVNEQHEITKARAASSVPVPVAFELALRAAGVRADPVRVVDDSGHLTEDPESTEERARAQAPGTRMPKTSFTYGTPAVDTAESRGMEHP